MRSLRWAIVLVAGLLLPRAAALAPGLVESLYSRGLFPGIAQALAQVAGRSSRSLTQIVLAAAFCVVLWLVLQAVSSRFGDDHPKRRSPQAHTFVAVLALSVWAFHALWGLNYARPPLARRLGIALVESDVEGLCRLTRKLAVETNRTYAWAEKGGQIHSRSRGDLVSSEMQMERLDIAERLEAAYNVLEPRFSGKFLSPPKFPALTSRIMTKAGISGFYFPFTGEANVNGQVPDAALPFTMAHEMAHQRGTAREDEANFWAYLACRESGLATARYSGALEAYGLALNALWGAAADSARAIASAVLDPGPRGDRSAIRAFWERNEGAGSRLATQVNDSYLKVNAQPAGVRTYGLAVDLLLALDAAGGLEE